MTTVKSEAGKHTTPPSFESISEAFNYCREKDQPVIVILDDSMQSYYGKYKLYPSGRADQLARCLCGSLDNHMQCPTHGDPQFVDWKAEKRARLNRRRAGTAGSAGTLLPRMENAGMPVHHQRGNERGA